MAANKGPRNATPIKASRQKPERVRRVAGAHSARTSLQDRFRSWRQHHQDSFKDALQRLNAARTSSAMTILVMTIALALPMGLSVLINQVKQLGVNWQEAAQISVYLTDSVSAEQQQALTEQVGQLAGVANAQLLDKDLALAEFQQHAGMGDALLQLDYNPLPSVIVVTPKSIEGGAAALEPLRDRLVALDGVDQVQIDLLWVERLSAILAMFERFASGLAVLLIIALLLVMANTIRLAIESRREEILVIKLVGGTDAFVRRPFLYIGVLYGLLAGLLAWVLLALGLAWLNVTVERVAALYQSDFALFGMPFTDGLALVFGAMLLGLAGAWLAVGQHVRAIEPQ